MKKLIAMLIFLLGMVAAEQTSAQVSININIGKPVAKEPWYAHDDDYYYMPDQDVYYNIQRRVYVYIDGGHWVFGASLPAVYGNVTYRKVRCVRIHERSPFDRDDQYRERYRHDNGKHKGWYKNGKAYQHDRDDDDGDHDHGRGHGKH